MAKNPIVHFEIGCTDIAGTQEFLQGLFDWQFSGDGTISSVDTGLPNGLTGHLAKLGQEWGHYVTVYVQVEDLEESVQRTRDLNGKVLVEPVTIKGRGRFAWISPPEGQIIGLWEAI